MYSMLGNKLKYENNRFFQKFKELSDAQITSFSASTAYETLIGIKLPLSIFWSIFSFVRYHKLMHAETIKMLIKNDVLHKVENNKYEWNKSYKNDANSAVITDVIEKNMDVDKQIENIEFMLFAGMETTGK